MKKDNIPNGIKNQIKIPSSTPLRDSKRSPLAPLRSVGARGVFTIGPLLYLNSNNTDETTFPNVNLLTPYHRKQAFVLSENCKRFINSYGIENIGFLTLTFPDNVRDPKEAYRRFNNMNRRFLSKFFGAWILVKERQVRGAWHYHILVVCPGDIRTNINFEEIAQGQYGSANARLRALWKLLRDRLPAYGFGRSELLPIRTTSEAIASYVGKYIAKQIGARKEEDKGVRLISYSSGQVRSSCKLSWNSDGSKEWRRKLKKFATVTKCYDLTALKNTFGSSWAYHLAPYIEAVDDLTPHEIQRIQKVYSSHMGQYGAKFYTPNKNPEYCDGYILQKATGEVLF